MQDIGLRSEFLSERMRHECKKTAESISHAASWQAFVGGSFFKRRLAFENIGQERMLEIAGMPANLVTGQSEWFVWLCEFMDSDSHDGLCHTNDSGCGPVFISNAFVPVIAFGQRKLREKMAGSKYATELLPCFVKKLTCDIVSLSHRCVFPELFSHTGLAYFNGKKEDYKGWYSYLFRTYPVLARLVFEFMVEWVGHSAGMAERLACDEQYLKVLFGVEGHVVSVDMGISDRHHGGQSAAVIQWSNGRKVVYKPHSSLSGKEWNMLTEMFSVETYRYAILEKQGYSYVEFVNYEDTNVPERFYFHSGGLIALCLITGASDLHCENIIAKKDVPVVVDTETIANPLVGKLGISPEECGLMSVRKYLDGVCIGDWGGLTSSRKGVNVPDVPFQQRYVDCIIEGFRSVMCRHKAAPELCIPLRFVLRDTMTYSLVQAQCLNRRFMTDGFLYSLPIERLSGVLDVRADMHPIYMKELSDMERMDIPYFYSQPSERGIYSDGELLVEHFFDMSVNEHIAGRVAMLNDEKEIERNIASIEELLESPKPPTMDLDEYLLRRLLKKN